MIPTTNALLKRAVPIEHWHEIKPWGFSNRSANVVFDFVKAQGYVLLTWRPAVDAPGETGARTTVWLTGDGYSRLIDLTPGYLFERSATYFDAFQWFAELHFSTEIVSAPLTEWELLDFAQRQPQAPASLLRKLAAHGPLLLSPAEYRYELQRAAQVAAQGLEYLPRELTDQSPAVLSPALAAHFQCRLGLSGMEIQTLGSYDGSVMFRFAETGVCLVTEPDGQEYFSDFESFRLLLALVKGEDPRHIGRDVWVEWHEHGLLTVVDSAFKGLWPRDDSRALSPEIRS